MELEIVREVSRAALQNLEAHRRRIDDLNVYPVPDGDTGTNLVLTLRSIVETLDASSAEGSEAVAKELSRAALMGARGNSGVIFSQIVRGFVDELGRSSDVNTPRLRRAFRGASDAAYRAVKRPVEGTMLTVIREMAEEAERKENRRLSPPELLQAVLARGEDALARTPEMLEVLRAAGVVDAGGAGLVEITRGLALGMAGEPIPDSPVETEALAIEAIHQELSKYRYCTVFVVEGQQLDLDALESELERIGDSLLVVGDESALKVHVHTDEPGLALSAATAIGVVEGVEIANMHVQASQREERLLEGTAAALPALATLETGLVAVCPGQGNRRLFESLGATRVIEGGQTMNPSTAELVEAIEATPAEEVLVLPNNSNVILTAEQAAELSSKPVRVLPVALGAGRSRRDGPVRADELAGPERAGHARRARLGGDGRGDRRLARRRARRREDPQGRLPRSRRRHRGRDRRRHRRRRVPGRPAGARGRARLARDPDRRGRAVGRGASRRGQPLLSRGRRGGARRRAAALPAARGGRVSEAGAGEEPVRVLLVEDNDVYRESIVFLLGRFDGLEVVGAVADGGSAASACVELRADVVVMDYRLPDIDGAEAAAEVRERCPQASIVFLSASAGQEELDAARREGAPLVRKDEGVDALVGAVRAATERMGT